MQAEDTVTIRCYLNARRNETDRLILGRLRADAARGEAASAVVRRALAMYYGIERPHENMIRPEYIDYLADRLAAALIERFEAESE